MSLTNVPDLSSRQLRAVLAVAENRSFIAAAAALKISQPALTRTIKQIEQALGVELFSRTTRQVTTTHAGKEFVALAERLLSDFKIGITSLQRHMTHPRGQVIVSSVLPLSDPKFPETVLTYRHKFPGIDIYLREGMHEHVVDDIRTGVADFGIGYLNALPDKFAMETLGIETLHVVFPVKHPLRRHKKIDISELRDIELVSYSTDARTRKLVDNLAAKAGFAPRHALVVGRFATLMNLVRHQVGVAIVPSSERPLMTDRQLTSRPLAQAPVTRLGIFHLRERELSQPAAEFRSLVREWIRAAAPRKLRAAKRQ
jgi:DNA-binding transcriptional LysR family regulator